MAEEIGPCPVCGGVGIPTPEAVAGGVLWHVHCESDACLIGESQPEYDAAVASWNRLSRAARLLRAWDVVAGEPFQTWYEDGQWHAAPGTGGEMGSGETPDAALVALAEEVGA